MISQGHTDFIESMVTNATDTPALKPATKTPHEKSDGIVVSKDAAVRQGKTERNLHKMYTIWILYAFSDEIVSQYTSTDAAHIELLTENDAIVSNVEESTTLQYTTEQGNF